MGAGTGPPRQTRAELVAAAVGAARQARQALAEAMRMLSPIDEGLAGDLSFAVAALFRAELDAGGLDVGRGRGADALRDRLREAAAVMSGVLSRLHAPELAAGLDLAGASLAKSLAVLYPARAGLERILHEDELDDAEASATSGTEAPPAMLFERPLAASFPRPPDAPRVYAEREVARSGVVHRDPSGEDRSERPTVREPTRPASSSAGNPASERPSERPSGRLRRNALALEPDQQAGLVDQRGQSGSLPPSERRVQDRRDFSVDIGLHTSTQFFAGISGDLSEGGLFVATYTPRPIGTELHVSFVLPGGLSISTPALVAWVRHASSSEGPEPGMGLRFYALPESEKQAIERFLKLRPPMLYEA